MPQGRALAFVDIAIAVWTVAWLMTGIAVAREVEGLAQLSGTVSTVGGAVDEAGLALQTLDAIPVVGDPVEEPAERIREAGQSALASGRRSRESIETLSPLLGSAIALIPTIPLLALYVPLRMAAVRERRALARLVARHGDDPRLERLLAQRALATLPYQDLGPATLERNGSREAGSTETLAAAELERLGIDGRGRR